MFVRFKEVPAGGYTARQVFYGYSGHASQYSKFDYQEYDFHMKTSREFNQNATDHTSGQFPYIYYANANNNPPIIPDTEGLDSDYGGGGGGGGG